MTSTTIAAQAALDILNTNNISSILRQMEKRREEYAAYFCQIEDDEWTEVDQALHDSYELVMAGEWRKLRLAGFTAEQADTVGNYIRDNNAAIYWTSADEFDAQHVLWVETAAGLVEDLRKLKATFTPDADAISHNLTEAEQAALADIWRKLFTLGFTSIDAEEVDISEDEFESMELLVMEQNGIIMTSIGAVPREKHIASLLRALEGISTALNQFLVCEDGDSFTYESDDDAVVSSLYSAQEAVSQRLRAMGVTPEELVA